MSDMIMKQPDGGYHVADASNLTKKDWHKTIRASDGTIPEEDIKKYYDIAMKLDWQDGWYSSDEMKKEAKTPGYKHIHLGGSDTSREEYEIEQDWVKEIWEQVNPGMKLLRHYLNGHHKGQSGGIHIDGWTADQYTAILYLTPGWEPEDGGTLELWTPNLNDEQKDEIGGLSGPPLVPSAKRVLVELYKNTNGKIPLISCGGIRDAADVYDRIRKGASLTQMYTAFIYNGPGLINEIKLSLTKLLHADGFLKLSDAIGVDHQQKKSLF